MDFERGVARLPDSKTGPKTLPLGAPALELLSALPRQRGNPYVCPGLERAAHFVGIQRPWRRIRSEAKLPDLRIDRFTTFPPGTGLSSTAQAE